LNGGSIRIITIKKNEVKWVREEGGDGRKKKKMHV